jgi:hypothetical protein
MIKKASYFASSIDSNSVYLFSTHAHRNRFLKNAVPEDKPPEQHGGDIPISLK